MTWVLIWVVVGVNSTATASQEFNSKKACEDAQKELKKKWGIDYSMCVPKGEK